MPTTDELLDFHLSLRLKNRKPGRFMGKMRAASGVTNMTDATYRRTYIDEYLRLMGGTVEEVEHRLDMWQVLEVEVDGESRWVPHPLWDVVHGYLVRPSFATEAEALAEIDRVGGTLQSA